MRIGMATVGFRRFLPSTSQPCKIVYFSDGAGAQYKNRKNFLNLCHHKEDFGISAEWNFSATAHGKGACDGIGGTVKRLAARASLQKPYSDQIMTPRQLFDWASTNIPAVHFGYCSLVDYEVEEKNIEERFAKSRTIPVTQKLHVYHIMYVLLFAINNLDSQCSNPPTYSCRVSRSEVALYTSLRKFTS